MKEALSTTESLYHGLNMAAQTIFNTANQLVNTSPPMANAVAQVAAGLTNLADMVRVERQRSVLTATDPALVALKRALGDKLPDLAWKPLQLATDVPIGPVTGVNENYAFTKEHLTKGVRFMLAIRRRLDKEFGKDLGKINARLAVITKDIPLYGVHENLRLEIVDDHFMNLTVSDGGFHHTLQLHNSNFLSKYTVQSRYTDEVFNVSRRSIGVQWLHDVLYTRLFWELEIETNELESVPYEQLTAELAKCEDAFRSKVLTMLSVTGTLPRFEDENIPQIYVILYLTYIHGQIKYDATFRPNCRDNDLALLGASNERAISWEMLPRVAQLFVIEHAQSMMMDQIHAAKKGGI